MPKSQSKISLKSLFKKGALSLLILTFFSFLLFLIIDLAHPFRADVEYSQIVTDKNDKVLYAYLTKNEKWRMKTELDEISTELKTALLFKEDKYFHSHPGINPIAIGRALFNNVLKQKRTSGASTITMQVARLLNPKPRTYKNKVIEIFNAFQLEWHYSKAEIFQFYINLIPFGGNIEGIKSASILYMEKTPAQLSLSEIACLSIIPNRPNSLTLGKHNELIGIEKNKWLRRYSTGKLFEQSIIEDALTEPVQAFRQDSPKFAPHFCYRMKKQYPLKDIIKTTLDYNNNWVLSKK